MVDAPSRPRDGAPAHARPAELASPAAPVERSARFDAGVDEIRRRYGSDALFPFRRPENWVRRRLGLPYHSVGATVTMGTVGVVLRLGLALAATAVAADWAQVNWVGWAVVLGFYVVVDAGMRFATPPPDEPIRPRFEHMVEDAMALLPTLSHESDIDDLVAFARRWVRLRWGMLIGVVIAAVTFGAAWIFLPDELGGLAAGTIVLLVIVLIDFGSITVTPVEWMLISREARYEHDLFWVSPADSPEVGRAMSTSTGFGVATGVWMTIYMVMTVVLVTWTSPLVLPLAGAFIVFGYLTVIVSTIGIRGSIRQIVRRARERRLAPLRERIAVFEPRSAELSPPESARLRDLLDLYSSIRDAPTSPAASHSLLNTAAALIVPAIVFVVSVSGEVYAERIFDTFLP